MLFYRRFKMPSDVIHTAIEIEILTDHDEDIMYT